jgi:4Fe-4S ferredoxin
MEIYLLLPETNCRRCGEASCFAFASKVTVGSLELEACLPLFEEDQYTDKRRALVEMLSRSTT